MALNSPFYYNVPSQTLAPSIAGNFGNNFTVNATFVNGGTTTVTISLYDGQGRQRDYNLVASAPVIVKRAPVRSFSINGNGATIAGVFSWPDEVDPSSIVVSNPVSVSVSITGPISVTVTNSSLAVSTVNTVAVSGNVSAVVSGNVNADITNPYISVSIVAPLNVSESAVLTTTSV